MSNTYIANGDWKLEEIMEELGDGIYLIGSRGGQVNTAEGVFQFNAKRDTWWRRVRRPSY